jgi:hypothetical protein
MFTYLTKKDYYLPKEYYKLLNTPSSEYYKAIKDTKNGVNVSYNDIKQRIEDSLLKAEELKIEGNNKKIDLKWSDYKKIINAYIERIFNNYIPTYEYEEKHGWELRVSYDGWDEDNYAVKYFCKSLTGYMMNYIRDNKPKEIKKKHCTECGIEIFSKSNRKKYCDKCFVSHRKNYQKNIMRKIRSDVSI